MLGVLFPRWMALLCAVLVLASTARTAHAMAETFLHENAVPHSAAAVTGPAHGHEGEERTGHHHDEEEHANQDHGGDAERGDDGGHPHGNVGHHHHADHSVDLVDLVGNRSNVSPRSFERLGVQEMRIVVSGPLWGIERPPRG